MTRALALALLTLAAGCRPVPTTVEVPPPPAVAGPSSLAALHADLDTFAARLDAVATSQAETTALVADLVCRRWCLAGYRRGAVTDAGVRCRCRQPNVGQVPISLLAKAAGRETLARPAGRER